MYCSLISIINASDSRNSKYSQTTHNKCCSLHLLHTHELVGASSYVRRDRGVFRCSFSKSCRRRDALVQSGTVDKFPANNNQSLFNYVRANGSRAYYKSEEFDLTESTFQSLSSSEGAGEVAFPDKSTQNAAFWLDQFPKRWVVVLLCFVAFLLCNMDRVSCQ